MNRRSLLAIGFAALALLAAGCTNSWRVVKQANPDPFVNQTKFGLSPIDYTNLRLSYFKTEAQHLAKKDADTKASFSADKEALDDEFTKALIDRARGEGINVTLASDAARAPFMIRPYVTFLEPGFFAARYQNPPPSRVVMS